MSRQFELSVIVTTYQRPGHLRRCLLSLAAQRHVAGKFEVIVVDDGSRDNTAETVARTAREAPYPLRFLTHAHDGFQVGRCRNSGIRAAQAPYLVFIDGDCLLPPDHLAAHLAARRPGVVRAGDCFRLSEADSERIGDAEARSGQFMEWAAPLSRKFIRRIYRKMLLYQSLGHGSKPKIVGWNLGIWREQLQRINGFDEQYRGWGCEDDDLGIRLRQCGARILTLLGHTHAFHLWHPIDATAPKQWGEGANIDYFQRPLRLSRCLSGLERRSLADVAVRTVADDENAALTQELFPWRDRAARHPELEVVVGMSNRLRFSSDANCRVLVAREDRRIPWRLRRTAHACIRISHQDDAASLRRQIERLLGAPEIGSQRRLTHGAA